jgi:hypothetical protein
MSQTAKIVIGVIVVLVIAGGIWYWSQGSWGNSALPSGSDTSDAALDQDMNSINANIQEVNTDSADADASVDAAESGTDQ